MLPTWLPSNEWRFVQDRIPIVCVDLLATRGAGRDLEVGLIFRETPVYGLRWCLIGGRLLLNEPISDAIGRQLIETLGENVIYEADNAPVPLTIAEYFSIERDGALFDPRQHAVSLIFNVQFRGHPVASGEARAFRWFHRNALPSEAEIGFGQSRILDAYIPTL